MKITKIDAFAVALPARRLHRMATKRAVDDLGRYTIAVVSTDEGVEGLGEATVMREWGGDNGRYYGESPELTVTVIRDILGPALEGADPFNIERANVALDVAI